MARRVRFVKSLGMLAVLLGIATAPLAGQGRAGSNAVAKKTTDGRLPWGDPDLQGIWTFATITPLERPKEFEGKPFLTGQEALELEKRAAETNSVDNPAAFENPLRGTPIYNQVWWDRGSKVAGMRTSLIIDPPDGKIPPMTPEGRKRLSLPNAGGYDANGADSWESRTLWERCITHNSLPRLSSGYNNNLEIIQSPGHVVISYEQIHESRVVPLDGRPHLPSQIRQWLGDSRGRWERDTLVVDTTNFSSKTNFRGSADGLHLIERFRRVDADTIDYQFTVEDPSTWVRPWTAALPLRATEGPILEYACHEGNQGMVGILSGARAEEEKAAAEAAKKK